MRKLRQTGYNPRYPRNPEIWKLGEKVPAWLSDRAKIVGFAETGELLLDIQTTPDGKVHIRDTARPIDLIVLRDSQDYVIYEPGFSLMTLSEEELDFLYDWE